MKTKAPILETQNKNIGQRLRTMRESNNESQQDLATALNTSRGTISKYERGLLALSPTLINRVCSRYKTTHCWLLTGKGPMTAPSDQQLNLQHLISALPPIALSHLKQFLLTIYRQ